MPTIAHRLCVSTLTRQAKNIWTVIPMTPCGKKTMLGSDFVSGEDESCVRHTLVRGPKTEHKNKAKCRRIKGTLTNSKGLKKLAAYQSQFTVHRNTNVVPQLETAWAS